MRWVVSIVLGLGLGLILAVWLDSPLWFAIAALILVVWLSTRRRPRPEYADRHGPGDDGRRP